MSLARTDRPRLEEEDAIPALGSGSWRRALLAAGLLLAACAPTPHPPAKRAVISHTLATTVKLFVQREGGVRRSGSAVVLSAGGPDADALILTTAHLLEPPVEQSVFLISSLLEERAPAEVVAVDPVRDLALVSAPYAAPAQVELAAGAELADEVLVVAFPWGRDRTVVKGAVSQISAESPVGGLPPVWGAVSLIDASVSYGMSGGGIFDRRSGRLVGMVRGYRTAHLSLSSEPAPVKVPIAGETTVVSTREIVCFLRSLDLERLVPPDVSAGIVPRLCDRSS